MKTQLNNQNIDELISTFGKREVPDSQMMRQAQLNVTAHWKQSLVKQKTKRMRLTMMRLAASFVALAAVLFFVQNNLSSSQAQPIGDVLFTRGEIKISDDRLKWSILDGQSPIKAGQWIKTPATGFVSFALSDESQVRLNSNTLLHIDSKMQLNLIKGELYHDADTQNTLPLIIKTALGEIQHIGTRYAVSVDSMALTVKVRNGRVKVDSSLLTTTLDKGNLIELTNTGTVNHSSITAYDSSWDWTQKATKPININHKSLKDFISHYAHEKGLDVNWNNLKEKTAQVELVGDFDSLNQSQLLKTVFLSTKFDFEINKGILTIVP